jgi:CubicO group peptidase (beta-lactamase class C family)
MARLSIALFSVGLFFSCAPKQAGTTRDLEARVDSLVKPLIDSSRVAGVAVGVFKDHQPLLLKGYGFADLEFDVVMPANASFEIGSVTKQFTAAATMLLAEQGKLSLEDDFTKYVPFDTHGKKVTIRQLLSHTSGIKGYTELPFFEAFAPHKYDRDTLLRIVEKEPFDFEPGDALIYNNSAFFIVGLIIEKVSGQSYADYVSKNLFEKAGMTNTYYCSENKITKSRAHGYDGSDKGLVRATYIDHNWPFSAGSLCSTVSDLEKWNDALHHGKILNSKSYEDFVTPVSLNDGTVTHYAKGITVTNWKGRRLIEHGGGIPGFLSQNSFFPDDNVSVIVLINSTTTGPREISDQIAEFLFGKSANENNAVFKGDLNPYAGRYNGRDRGQDLTVTVTENDTLLSVQMGDNKADTLHYVKDDVWSDGRSTFHFKGEGNTMKQLAIDQTYGYLILKKE